MISPARVEPCWGIETVAAAAVDLLLLLQLHHHSFGCCWRCLSLMETPGWAAAGCECSVLPDSPWSEWPRATSRTKRPTDERCPRCRYCAHSPRSEVPRDRNQSGRTLWSDDQTSIEPARRRRGPPPQPCNGHSRCSRSAPPRSGRADPATLSPLESKQ